MHMKSTRSPHALAIRRDEVTPYNYSNTAVIIAGSNGG